MNKLISGSLLALSLVGAMPVMAQTTESVNVKTANLQCMQTAVEKRDGSIIAAWDVVSASIKTALTTRQSSLKAAWGINNRQERRAAIKAAWNAFRTSKKDARNAFNDSRKAAWKQFGVEAKACGGNLHKEETGSVGADIGI